MIEPVERYLLTRQSLGYRDTDLGRNLRAFAAFAAARGACSLRLDDALAWAADRRPERPRFDLLAGVRRLGQYLKAEDPAHEIVPEEYTRPPRRARRRAPFIYTGEEIGRVLDAFYRIPLPDAFDAVTYRHIIGLIATTGVRISEAVNLKIADFRNGALFVRKGKFGKDRLIYLHDSTVSALNTYLRSRPAHLDGGDLFVIHTNRAPGTRTVDAKFRRCINLLGLRARAGSHPPRVHDLRHTFAVRSLAACGFDRDAVSNHVVALSTHMGHVSMASTFWYAELTSETKRSMAQALEEALNV